MRRVPLFTVRPERPAHAGQAPVRRPTVRMAGARRYRWTADASAALSVRAKSRGDIRPGWRAGRKPRPNARSGQRLEREFQ